MNALPRVAVLMKSYLGDAVMAEPLLRGLLTRGHEVWVQTSPAARAVLGHLDFQAHPMGPRRNARSVLADARALRAWSPGIALVVNRSFRAALTARLARVPIRVGHASDARRGLLTASLPYDEARYEAACYTALAEAAGLPMAPPSPRLVAPPCEAELPRGAVGLQPGARYAAKTIPEGAIVALIADLERRGRPIVLLGGPEEREACERVASPSCTILAGTCSIPQTLAALSRLSAFVGGDTGLSHMAFGVRTPSLAVFGPTPALKWTHGEPQRVLVAPEGDLSRVTGEDLARAFSSVCSYSQV